MKSNTDIHPTTLKVFWLFLHCIRAQTLRAKTENQWQAMGQNPAPIVLHCSDEKLVGGSVPLMDRLPLLAVSLPALLRSLKMINNQTS